MSTLQHINSVVNYNWPELSRKYPGFEKPQIVPAETLRGLAPTYLRSAIDQDPTSMYMFIAGDARKGDCSREKACEFFDELFYEKLQMPSSYEANEGYTREEAIDKEVLPPATNQQFRSFYDEQMAKVDAEEARKRRIENLGFDPDDGNTIDVDVDDGSSSDARAVGQAQSTAVGMPKKIFYCVDFHCPAGGMLGYNGGGAGGRLGGGRGGRRFLREADTGTPVSDILRAYEWAKTTTQGSTSLVAGLEAIAKAKAADDATGRNAAIHRDFNLYIFKYGDGRTTWIEEEASRPGNFNITWSNITDAMSQNWARRYQTVQATVVTKAELDAMGSHLTEENLDDMMQEALREADLSGDDLDFIADITGQHTKSSWGDPAAAMSATKAADKQLRKDLSRPDQAEKFGDLDHAADLGDDDLDEEDVEEDDMLKNRPHNLHKDELNESFVNFATRLIRG